MMKIIDTFVDTGIYKVVYDCGDGVFKVAIVGEKIFGLDPNKKPAQLQIQKIGLEFSLDVLDFEGGILSKLNHVGLNGGSIQYFDEKKPEIAEKILKRYAPKFEEMFQFDSELRLFLPDYFTALQKYLPDYSIAH